jgi:hypothetical protein
VHQGQGRKIDLLALPSPPIPGLLPIDDGAVPNAIDPDKRTPAPMLRRPGYALSGVTALA